MRLTGAFLSTTISDALVALAERVTPSVVQLVSAQRGAGTGIIWGAEGLVLTNYHVIAHAPPPVGVLLEDDRLWEANVVAQEPSLDLALLQLPRRAVDARLAVAPIGDSAALRVGELVVAVGHPWGQRNVVTAGIISALGTLQLRGSEQRSPFLRSNVALAPGNSGGPLLNSHGEVIGINSMIFGGDLAVSIPSNVAQEWIVGLR